MKRFIGLFVGAGFVLSLVGGVAWAVPPGPGQHFNCSNGGTTSCATDDKGCVSDTKAHLKCAAAIGKAFAKAVGTVIKCHGKQATARAKGTDATTAGSAEETCEGAAQTKLDSDLGKVASICSTAQNSGAAVEESTLFTPSNGGSLDAQNNMVFCDSASAAMIGDDDTGFVPNSANNLKCALTVGKMVSKLVAAGIKCHAKMDSAFFGGKDFDEEMCEETNGVSHAGALDKYNQQRDKLAGLAICPGCLDSTHLNALATSVLLQLDNGNAVGNPCP